MTSDCIVESKCVLVRTIHCGSDSLHLHTQIRPIPVVVDIAKAAQAQGLKLAVATSSEEDAAKKV